MLYQKGDQHGVSSLMKTIWLADKEQQKKEFYQDQAKDGELLFLPYTHL